MQIDDAVVAEFRDSLKRFLDALDSPSAETLLYPDALEFDVAAIELGGSGENLRGFFTVDKGDHYELDLGSSSPTTNLPLHSRIEFSLAYVKDGRRFRFEDQVPPALHLYHTSKCVANVGGSSVSIGPGKGSEMVIVGKEIAHWSPRWEQTGGMDPVLKITAAADERIVVVNFSVPVAGVSDKPLWLPKAS